MMLRLTRIGFAATVAWTSTLIACSEPTAPASNGLVSGVISPAWSADGREIFFTDRGTIGAGFTFTLKAVNVGSGALRTLSSTPGTNTGGEFVVAPKNAQYVFYSISASIGPHYLIYRVPVAGGQLDTIASDARWATFRVSDDGRSVAYQSGVDAVSPGGADTLKIVDGTRAFGSVQRAVRTTASALGIGSFSPDGAYLVYSDGSTRLLNLASGASTVLYTAPTTPTGANHEATSGSVWWDGSRPHLLVAAWTGTSGPTSIYDLDGASGTRTLIGVVAEGERPPFSMAWSPDGSRAAIWVSPRAFNCTVEGCSYDGRLYLLTKGAASARIIFDTGGAPASPRWTVFSPDGLFVGTVNWSGLFVYPL